MPRFNYTHRRKINRSDIEIKIQGVDQAYFTANINLQNYNFPIDASVVIEAYRHASWMRFEFGTIGRCMAPQDTFLTNFDVPDAILFRVKIIENSPHKKIIAMAKEIRPRSADETADNRISLLPLKPHNLAYKIWDIEFTNEGPLLLVNNKLDNPKYLTKSPVFQALVFPEVIKAVYSRILLVEMDKETDWCKNWLQYSERLPGTMPVPDISIDLDINKDEREDWIEEISNAFSKNLNTFELFNKNWREA